MKHKIHCQGMTITMLCIAQCVRKHTTTIPTVKGMTNMITSKSITKFVDQLVFHYAKYDKHEECYFLDINDIAEFDLHKLSALIMSEDICYASEACGPDNNHFENSMLPALLKYLSNTSNKDNHDDFANTWKEGITSYFNNTMQELLEQRLEQYNEYTSSGARSWVA